MSLQNNNMQYKLNLSVVPSYQNGFDFYYHCIIFSDLYRN